MSNLTDYGEQFVANAIAGIGALHMALHTADPGETGATSEITGDGVTRQSSAYSAAAGVLSNDAAIQFNATADKGVATHFTLWDAASGGNCVLYGPLTDGAGTPDPITWPGGAIDFAAGDVTATAS